MADISKRLADLMAQFNIDQVELAKKSGVTQGTISHILTGRRVNTKISTLKALAGAFNLTVDDLLGVKKTAKLPGPIPVIGKGIASPEGAYYTDEGLPAGAAHEYWEVKDPNAFILEVENDSMAPTAKRGDWILVTPNTPPSHGDIALVRLSFLSKDPEKTYLKRVEFKDRFVILKSDNPAYEVMIFERADFVWMYRIEAIIPR